MISLNKLIIQFIVVDFLLYYVLNAAVLEHKTENEKHSFIPCSDDESYEIKKILEDAKCQNCDEENKTNLTAHEMNLLRGYIVKSKILEELNMKKEPCPKMPKPSLRVIQAIVSALDNSTEDVDVKDDITRITRKDSIVIFPKTETHLKCSKKELCRTQLEFFLPTKIEAETLYSLELWIPKTLNDQQNEMRPIFFMSDNSYQENWCELEAIDGQDRKQKLEEWHKFNLDLYNCSKLFFGQKKIVVEITGLVYIGDNKPFLLAQTVVEEKRLPIRSRRSALCVQGTKTCCRQPFHLNFTELNMDRWILYPSGYSAYSCTGECLSDISTSRDHYTTLLMDYIRKNRSSAKSLGLSVCCVPSAVSPLSIVYRDSEDNIYPERSIPGMIVEGCVCA